MRARAEAGFRLAVSDLRNDIIIPRYYDPRIADALAALEPSHELRSIGDLIRDGSVSHSHGDYVPKMNYGSGPYPYVRTSDLSNWEVRASPKHGVSADILEEYGPEQDVQADDILFVHEGTYLIGTTAMVSAQDGPILYQHHVAKFRVNSSAKFSAHYLIAALGSPIVQKQIRARQFSADIIDSVVGRVEEIIIPIVRDENVRHHISSIAKDAIEARASYRTKLNSFLAKMEELLNEGDLTNIESSINELGAAGGQTFLGDRKSFVAFKRKIGAVSSDIFIPKYYNPAIAAELKRFEENCRMVTIGELVDEGALRLSTGDEIGRLNYDTGVVSFVRTSDLGTYELKADAKQGVDEGVLLQYKDRQDVTAGDILLVRDGTYLVGSTAIVYDEDLPLLYCGGIYKLRFSSERGIKPGLGYALLNLPIVKRQMRSKQFTRDVIDTLGQRLLEVTLPVPKSSAVADAISEFVFRACQERVTARAALSDLCSGLFASQNP